jgi:hypothetical protein
VTGAPGTPRGTSEDTPIPDKRYTKSDHPGERTGVFLHEEHFFTGHGSLGCDALQEPAGVDKIGANATVTVDYQFNSIEDVQKAIEQKLGKKDIDWAKIERPVPPNGTNPGGVRSKTKNGSPIKAKDFGVGAGTKRRKISYLTAPLDGGAGEVTKGTASIVLGPPQHPVAAVTHGTTDGSPIANGEDSVHMLT